MTETMHFEPAIPPTIHWYQSLQLTVLLLFPQHSSLQWSCCSSTYKPDLTVHKCSLFAMNQIAINVTEWACSFLTKVEHLTILLVLLHSLINHRLNCCNSTSDELFHLNQNMNSCQSSTCALLLSLTFFIKPFLTFSLIVGTVANSRHNMEET